MSLLFKIVYAAHANGTHHKLALDALRDLSIAESEDWRRLFLAHASRYLEGSKAPDVTFKDFKNHVLHPRDNYWGGAPEKVREWYAALVDALRSRDWETAVYNAGVVSHYFTDPIHPFHTAQSQAESNIHRAAEWTISKSYDTLRTMGLREPMEPLLLDDGPDWLSKLVIAGAERSNAQYEKLIAHYDFQRGVVAPTEGYDSVGQMEVARLLIYAARSFALVLDRAIIEAAVTPLKVQLTAETVLAALQVPLKFVLKKLADAEDRREVEAMYDELKSTGIVEATLPADDRAVRAAYEAEVAKPRAAKVATQRQARVTMVSTAATPGSQPAATAPSVEIPVPVPMAPVTETMPAHETPAPAALLSPAPSNQTSLPGEPTPRSIPPLATLSARLRTVPAIGDQAFKISDLVTPQPKLTDLAPEEAPALPAAKPASVSAVPIIPAVASRPSRSQVRLSLDADVVDAPSIGPKTAERLASAGVKTVRDLLEADADALSAKVGQRHITAAIVRDWQDQARLVSTVPDLSGGAAQLLVGAGLRTVDEIAVADPNDLMSQILAYAATHDGQRILRDGAPPDLAKITAWIHRAALVRAA